MDGNFIWKSIQTISWGSCSKSRREMHQKSRRLWYRRIFDRFKWNFACVPMIKSSDNNVLFQRLILKRSSVGPSRRWSIWRHWQLPTRRRVAILWRETRPCNRKFLVQRQSCRDNCRVCSQRRRPFQRRTQGLRNAWQTFVAAGRLGQCDVRKPRFLNGFVDNRRAWNHADFEFNVYKNRFYFSFVSRTSILLLFQPFERGVFRSCWMSHFNNVSVADRHVQFIGFRRRCFEIVFGLKTF